MPDPRFFNDIEGAPWSDVLRLKREKLVAQLGYLGAHSVFYRQKLAARAPRRHDVVPRNAPGQVPRRAPLSTRNVSDLYPLHPRW